MHAESPGTGLSTGCPTSGGPNETDGGKVVIDWLNGRQPAFTTQTGNTQVTADWTTGKVGMIGTSYNGTLPEGVATTGVAGLEAIVPISAISSWYDYYREDGAVRAPYTFQGEDLDVLEDDVYSRANKAICQDYIRNVTATGIDRITGDYNAFWDARNYMNNVQNVHAAALIAHGNMDLNVMPKNMNQYLLGDQGAGRPASALLPPRRPRRQSARLDDQPLVHALPLRRAERRRERAEGLGRARDERLPAASGNRQGDQSNTNTLTVADSSQITYGIQVNVQVTSSTGTVSNSTATVVAVPDSTHVVFAAAVATAAGSKVANGSRIGNNITTTPTNSVTCGANSPTPYAEWPDPNASVANVDMRTPGNSVGDLTFRDGSAATETIVDAPTTTLFSFINSASNPGRLVYRSPVLAQSVRISGTVMVDLMDVVQQAAGEPDGRPPRHARDRAGHRHLRERQLDDLQPAVVPERVDARLDRPREPRRELGRVAAGRPRNLLPRAVRPPAQGHGDPRWQAAGSRS